MALADILQRRVRASKVEEVEASLSSSDLDSDAGDNVVDDEVDDRPEDSEAESEEDSGSAVRTLLYG